jgi:hypothetical protein
MSVRKQIFWIPIMLWLAGCTNNNNTMNPEVVLLVKLIIGVAVITAVFAAFAAILIRGSSERRFTAGLVAIVAVTVGTLFLLVLIA